MSRNKIILLIGLIIAAMPFLGFPMTVRIITDVVAGLILIIIAAIGHVSRRSPIIEERREVVTEVYVETNGRQEV